MGRLFVVVSYVLVALCGAVNLRFTDAEILEKMRPYFEQHGEHMSVRDAKSAFGIGQGRWMKLKRLFRGNLPPPLFPSSGHVPDNTVVETFRSDLGLNVSSVVAMMDITEEKSSRCRRLVLSSLSDEQIVGFLPSNEHLPANEVVSRGVSTTLLFYRSGLNSRLSSRLMSNLLTMRTQESAA